MPAYIWNAIRADNALALIVRALAVVCAVGWPVHANAAPPHAAHNTGNAPSAQSTQALNKTYGADPYNHQLRVALGLALVRDGDYARAEKLLSAAFRKERSDEIEIALARARFSLGRYQDVLDGLRDVGANDAAARLKTLLRLEALLRLRRYDEIIAASGEDSADRDVAFSFAAARAHYGLGDVSAALDLFDDVLRSGYLPHDAWLARARIALGQNDVAFARKAMRRAVEAGMLQSAVAPFMIEADIRDGDFAKARNDINALRVRADGTTNKDVRLVYAAAFLAAAQGDDEAAVRLFDEIASWLATEPRGLLLMAAAKIRSGALAQGEVLLNRHRAASPGDWIALDMAAALNMQKKSYDEALMLTGRYADRASRAAAGQGAYRRFCIYLLQRKYDDAYGEIKQRARKTDDTIVLQTTSGVLFGRAPIAHEGDDCNFAAYKTGIERLRALYAREPHAGSVDLSPTGDEQGAPILLAINSEVLVAMARDDEAAVLLDRALEQAPGFVTAGKLRRRIDVRKGKFWSAQMRLSKSRMDNPDVAAETLALAIARLNAGEAQNARRLLDGLDGRSGLGAALVFAKARAYRELDDTKAHKKLARQISARHNDRTQLKLSARLFEEAGDIDAAFKAAKRAVSAAPGDLETLTLFAGLVRRNDRGRDGVIFLEVLVRRGRDVANARYILARLTHDLGEPATVEKHISVLKDAGAPQADWFEVYRHGEAGEYARAHGAAQKLSSRDYDDPHAAVEASNVAAKAGSIDVAEAILRKAAAARPYDISLVKAVARLRVDYNLPGASDSARKAYLLCDGEAAAATVYALALWRENRSEAALAMSREAVWAGLPTASNSLALAGALKANAYEELARAILRQIRSSPLGHSDQESADKMLQSITRTQAQPNEFKRLRG